MEKYLAEYLRLSMEDGDIAVDDAKQESDSISYQRELIKNYKEQNELSNFKSMEFADDGYSGTNFNRPGVTELMTMVKEGKISCIIVKDISRFGRNYLEVGDYLEQVFPFMGVRFISINDHYDSNDYIGTTGGIEVAFKSMLYDMYSKDLSVKMKSALEIRRKHGDCTSPVPPFGYLHASDNKKKLVIDLAASKYVLRVFQLASLGNTTGMVARLLNEEGIPTPGRYKNMSSSKRKYSISDTSGYWNAKMVRSVLENKVYLGMIVNKKREVLRVGAKQYRNVPEGEQICVPDMHEPIVTEELFREANGVLRKWKSETDRKKRKRMHAESILLGKLFCGECGRRLIRCKCTTIPYFKCERTDFDKNCSCLKYRLGEPEIEDVIKKCIVMETEKISDWRNEFETEKLIDNIEHQIDIQMKEADSLKLHKQYVYEKLKTGCLEQEKYKAKMKTIRVKEAKNRKATEECRKLKMGLHEKTELLKGTNDYQYITRKIVDALIERINVYDVDRIEIIWRFRFWGN